MVEQLSLKGSVRLVRFLLLRANGRVEKWHLVTLIT